MTGLVLALVVMAADGGEQACVCPSSAALAVVSSHASSGPAASSAAAASAATSSAAASQATSLAAGHGQSAALPEPPTDQQLPGIVANMIKALHDQDYQAASAAALMALVWFLRKVALDRVMAGRVDLLPWLGLAIAVMTGVYVGLQAHEPLSSAIMSGVLIGLAASGGWSLVGKHVANVLAALSGKAKSKAKHRPVKPDEPPTPSVPSTPV